MSDQGESFSDILRKSQLLNHLHNENPGLLTKGQLDWMIRHRKDNGLSDSGAILEIQHRLFFHKQKFIEWMLSNAG